MVVIKLWVSSWAHPGSTGWAPSPNKCSYEDAQTEQEKQRAEVGGCSHKPRATQNPQDLGEAGSLLWSIQWELRLPTPSFYTRGLQNCEEMHLCCCGVKPPSLWWFVTAALGKYLLHNPSPRAAPPAPPAHPRWKATLTSSPLIPPNNGLAATVLPLWQTHVTSPFHAVIPVFTNVEGIRGDRNVALEQ